MKFLTKQAVIELHDEIIATVGGEAGMLNEASLDSALGAAANRAWYEQASLAQCAATYAFHVAKAHAFVDGNKRIAVVAVETFLSVNGASLVATDREVHALILRIASSAMTRDEVDAWMSARVRESPEG
jgi:death-on-curing protein